MLLCAATTADRYKSLILLGRESGKAIELIAGVKRRRLAPLVLTAIFLADALSVANAQEAQSQITFKSGVEVVTVSAAVRDGRNRVIRDLKKTDFEVLDAGAPIEIRDFYAGDSPVSLAVLLDISGSMAVGGNMDRARQAVNVAMGNLRPGGDEAALFTFDSKLEEVVSFTTDLDRVRRSRSDAKRRPVHCR